MTLDILLRKSFDLFRLAENKHGQLDETEMRDYFEHFKKIREMGYEVRLEQETYSCALSFVKDDKPLIRRVYMI